MRRLQKQPWSTRKSSFCFSVKNCPLKHGFFLIGHVSLLWTPVWWRGFVGFPLWHLNSAALQDWTCSILSFIFLQHVPPGMTHAAIGAPVNSPGNELRRSWTGCGGIHAASDRNMSTLKPSMFASSLDSGRLWSWKSLKTECSPRFVLQLCLKLQGVLYEQQRGLFSQILKKMSCTTWEMWFFLLCVDVGQL